MSAYLLQALLAFRIVHSFLIDTSGCHQINILTRDQWKARAPTDPANLTGLPLAMVFVHHTDMSHCSSVIQCAEEVRTIQNFHMDERGWDDIGYSFLIGENGSVFEGRGWYRVGAHTYSYNREAFGIALLGNFMYRRPRPPALASLKALIQCGVDRGHIKPSYHLFGHRDTGQGTACPGDVLYDIIQRWSRFDPSGPKH